MTEQELAQIRALVAHMQANINEDQPERIEALIASYEMLKPYIERLKEKEQCST